MFIVIDGPDGTGKSTLARGLVARLQEAEIDAVGTAEPYLPTTRAWLSDPAISPRALLIAFAHDRDRHLREVVEPALAEGKVVVCDRYTYSTVAYQSLHNPPDLVGELVEHVLRPDLTFFLTCPLEVTMARIVARALPADRYDRAVDLQARLHKSYAESAARDCNVVTIDASEPPEVVLDSALFIVTSLWV